MKREQVFFPGSCLHSLFDFLNGRGVLPETVFEAALDITEMGHTAGTSGLSALSLETPVVAPQLGGWVSTLSAGFVLPVEGTVAASTAQSVRLGVSLTEGRGTFRHGFPSLSF